jgi:hypothetical protein
MVFWDKLLTSHRMERETRAWIKKTMDEIKEKQDALKVTDLKIDGFDLINLGYKGKQLGDVLRKLLEIVIDDPEKNNRESLLQLIPGIPTGLSQQNVVQGEGQEWPPGTLSTNKGQQ